MHKHKRTSCRLLAIACLIIAGTAPFALTTPPAAVTSTDATSATGSASAAQGVLSPTATTPTVMARPVEALLAERIAKKVIAASPIADPNDPKSRDLAAQKLGECHELLDAASGRILWGGFNPDQGYDPNSYRLSDISKTDHNQLTEFLPLVWAKLYLSTFMFTGKYDIRQEGRMTVLELDAKFRAGLDPGEYPYPFWHSPNKWTAYVNAEKILLVFEPGRLVAAMRKSPPPLSLNLIKRPWDAKWAWTDGEGQEQPRVTLFSYVFSKGNPHVTPLDASFRKLEEQFRAQNCMLCHQPDNRGRLNDLLLLNYPNQALIMRRSLVTLLEENQMPPGNVQAHEPTGIQDPAALKQMIESAKEFERVADAAFLYEQNQRAATANAPSQPAKPSEPSSKAGG